MVKRRNRKQVRACRSEAFYNFLRRAAYMLVVLFVAAVLIANLGGESFSALSFVKDAAAALAVSCRGSVW